MRNGWAILVAGVTAMTAMPVQAAGRQDHHHHRPRHGTVYTGDLVIGGLLITGIVAAMASAKPAPPGPAADMAWSDPQDAAANACADAVEDQLDDDGTYGRVDAITLVEPTANGFTVRGLVRVDEGTLGKRDGRLTKFRCAVRSAGVRGLVIG